MSDYIEVTDPEAFIDFTKKEPRRPFTKECPRCKGHGGWNLKLNAYPLPTGHEDTPENRHLYVHFKCCCSHCNGRGYVHPSVTCPGHEWVFVKNLGRCYNRYRCSVCGGERDIDSSD